MFLADGAGLGPLKSAWPLLWERNVRSHHAPRISAERENGGNGGIASPQGCCSWVCLSIKIAIEMSMRDFPEPHQLHRSISHYMQHPTLIRRAERKKSDETFDAAFPSEGTAPYLVITNTLKLGIP
ncbi:hypothetical protein COCC4DRAFT_138503 [Bipolaris maydis ATCC 48331]|uniref:Uncharacterized protein n=2 Tax=Cochliobolus heterostrophus TaxID=5016 RepID=M2U6L9_COCH5|nr:uncharacterized protein COCC4DRAFT_138503 [Bipolaris maydis ATCC 48331]EMD89361.1 hypothetical protein COCHEDRAFT_1032402 [Bipolaris maydis C5]ENI04922.1 hypothetical protein COCC4DRAFT_138503 [Bipolaris maydis ATCC 48331]KAJ6212710.1 hypothetical protein PSV09DRAFT_1032402 [Bipolaris maydis]